MKETVRLMGRAIKEGSLYLPTRKLAASLATQADPKDYLGQARAIFNGFLKRWRYVKDPVSRELLTASPHAVYKLVLAGDGKGYGSGFGGGDCDCSTVGLGSMFESVGLPVRIVTISPPGTPPGKLMSHVYPEVHVPGHGWIAADPVLYPRAGFGSAPAFARKAIWNLVGKIVATTGNFAGMGETMTPNIWRRAPYETFGRNIDEYYNYWEDEIDDDIENIEPFGEVLGFGSLTAQMGYINGCDLAGLSVEVDEDDIIFDGLVEAPILEFSPDDYRYLATYRKPYDGMLGLSQDGEVYAWDGFDGIFKRLLKRIKTAGKKVKKKFEQLKKKIKKDKSGKPAVKVSSDGTFLTAVKAGLFEPIIEDIRDQLRALVPVAAVVPGHGPALAVALKSLAKSDSATIAANAGALIDKIVRIKEGEFKEPVKATRKPKKATRKPKKTAARPVQAAARASTSRRDIAARPTGTARLTSMSRPYEVPPEIIEADKKRATRKPKKARAPSVPPGIPPAATASDTSARRATTATRATATTTARRATTATRAAAEPAKRGTVARRAPTRATRAAAEPARRVSATRAAITPAKAVPKKPKPPKKPKKPKLSVQNLQKIIRQKDAQLKTLKKREQALATTDWKRANQRAREVMTLALQLMKNVQHAQKQAVRKLSS